MLNIVLENLPWNTYPAPQWIIACWLHYCILNAEFCCLGANSWITSEATMRRVAWICVVWLHGKVNNFSGTQIITKGEMFSSMNNCFSEHCKLYKFPGGVVNAASWHIRWLKTVCFRWLPGMVTRCIHPVFLYSYLEFMDQLNVNFHGLRSRCYTGKHL